MGRPDYSRLVTIPAMGELSTRRNWCVWRLTDGPRPTKVPYVADGGNRKLNTTDPDDWADLKSAIDSYVEGEFSGIGFVFSAADPYVGVDLDKCVDDQGRVEPWAAEIVAKLASYTEFSPSGRGLHVICRGKLPENTRRKRGPLEIYDRERYFTITGRPYPGSPTTIAQRTDILTSLVEGMGQADQRKPGTPKLEALVAEIQDACTADARANPHMLAVLEENSPRFADTWNRRLRKDHWSDSEWDLSVANYLIGAGWPNPEIARALIEHRRAHGQALKTRGKAEIRVDYLARTIIRAAQQADSLEAEDRITDPALDDLPADEKRREVLKVINASLWPSGDILIEDFVMHLADPPTFVLRTNKNPATVTKEQLLSCPQMHRELAVATMKLPRRLKQQAHDRMVDRLFEIVRRVEIGEEATDAGKTRQYVHDYLRDRALHIPKDGQFKPEALAEGVPVVWQTRVCIQTKDLDDWLRRSRGVKMTPRQICGLLGDAGLTNTRISAGRSSRSVWQVPEELTNAT